MRAHVLALAVVVAALAVQATETEFVLDEMQARRTRAHLEKRGGVPFL